MKRKWGLAVVLAVICAVLLCIGVAADTVAEGTCGENLTWVLDDAGVLTISGEGEMEDYDSGTWNTPWHPYRKKINSIVLEEGVTSIGTHAFDSYSNSYYYYSALVSHKIPNSLTSIERYAFNCCAGLTSIEFPKNLAYIDSYAFDRCSNLSEIKINSNIHINNSTFSGTSLQIVHISNTVEELSYNYGILSIPTITEFDVDDTDDTGLVSVDGVLYSYDDYLETYTLIRYPAAKEGTEYTIIDNTETIGEYAFTGCNLLSRINIANSVQNIVYNAFGFCDILSTLQWGANVITVHSYYSDGSPITKIILPENSKTIPKPSTVLNYEVPVQTGIGYRDIDGVLFYYNSEADQLTLTEYPDGRTDTEYTIPDGTDTIGSSAFSNNKSLTQVFFNDGLTTIGVSSFWSCTGLKKVNFPDTLKTIDGHAFHGCTYLKEISFPESLQSIGWYSFCDCTALRRTTFYGDTPNSCSSNTFTNTHSTFTIYYIEGKSGWTSPTWNGYKTATFVPEGYSLTLNSTSPYKITADTIVNVSANTTASAFLDQFTNTNISVTTAAGTSLSDTDFVGTGCVVSLTVDGTVVDSRTILVTGDLTGDGRMDANDLLPLQQYYSGYAVTIDHPLAADLNGDGKLTRADAMMMARKLAGWKDALTPQDDIIVID